MQIILSGELIDAQEALRIGLVNEVVSREPDLASRSDSQSDHFQRSPGSEVLIDAVNKGLEATVLAGLFIEASLFAVCADSEDKKEGTSAFMAKRAPQFKGR